MASNKGGLKEKLKKLLHKIIQIDFKTDNPMAIFVILLMLIISVTLIATTKNLIDISKNKEQNNLYNKQVEGKIINKKKDIVSVYKKLRVGENINTLVLGDDIGNGGEDVSSENWVSQLASWIGVKYGITDNTTNLSLNDGTSYSEFNELMENEKSNYDLVLIVLGKNDEKQMDLEEFGITYEGIIREIRKLDINTTIIPIIEDSMDNDEYINEIINLSKHYNLDYVNAKETARELQEEAKIKDENNQNNNEKNDNNKDKSNKNNSSDKVDINEIYFKAVNNVIVDNVGDTKSFIDNAKDREMRRDITPYYNRIIDLDSYKCVSDYKETNGFSKVLNFMEGKNLGDSIEYEVPGNTIGLMYKGDSDGAIMQVYINNKLCKEINTKDNEEQDHYIMLGNNEEVGNNEVKIVQASGTKVIPQDKKNNNTNDKNQNQQNQSGEVKQNHSNNEDNNKTSQSNNNVNNKSNDSCDKSNLSNKNNGDNKKSGDNKDKQKENNDEVVKIVSPIGYNIVQSNQ